MLGLVSWLLPFAASFLFVDRHGQFVIPQPLFKSLMVVLAGGVCSYLLLRAFRDFTPTARTGLLLGLYWMAINVAMDLLVLLPIAKMSLTGYLHDIGLRYLLIPIIGAVMGAVAAENRHEHLKART